LGAYRPVLAAINTRGFTSIAAIGAGAIVGLLSFSSLLKWLFLNFKNYTLAILTGFIIGSLNKIWPWKETITWRINSHGIKVPFNQQSRSPFHAQDSQLLYAAMLAIVGFSLILLLEKLAAKRE
jgi:putative membrane protein